MKILFFVMLFVMQSTFAQDNCDLLPRLEERVERLRLTCSTQSSKCRAGYTNGLSPEEAVKNCVESRWSDRNGCIGSLSCEGMTLTKCKAGYTNGLSADEAVKNCVESRFSDRNGCISSLTCEGKKVSKCKAGYTWGLNTNEAVDACVQSRWSDRSGCISNVSCTDA